MKVPLHRKVKPSPKRSQFRETNISKFRRSKAQVAQAKREVLIQWIDLCQQPRRPRIGRKELYDWHRVMVFAHCERLTVVAVG